MEKIEPKIKKLIILSITLLVIAFILMIIIGTIYNSMNPNRINNEQQKIKITEKEVYQRLINRNISYEYGNITISEILDNTLALWNLIEGNADIYGGYANHIEGNLWEVGVYITADGDVIKYSWQYNVKTDEEMPLSKAAKELYP